MKNSVTSFGCLILILVTPTVFAGTDPIGKVVSLSGTAESSSLKHARNARDRLTEGSPVFAGDKIATHENTTLRILLSDKIALQMGPSTEMTLNHPAPRDTSVDLKKGSLMSSVHPKIGGIRPRFNVRTKSASMGVRGTTFFVHETASKPTFVCICHGTVAVKTKEKETPITSEHHDAPKFVDPENGALLAAKAGIDHKDEDAAALQKLVE